MALPFRNVKDIYDQLHDAGAVSSSLPDWSNEMNRLSQTDLFNAGLSDNFIKDTSVGIDRALEATGLPNLTGQLGSATGSLVGNPEAGQRIGQGLPRMAVNFAPLMAAGLVTGGAAPAAYAAGLLGTGALSGAETYTQTGSPGAGLLSGLTNVAMPGVANLGENAVLRGLGAKYLSGPISDELGNVTGQLSQYFPTTGQHVASFLGGQVAAAGLGEASSVGQSLLSGDPYHFSPSEAALNLTLGQLPFAAMHLAGKVVGREASVPTFTDVDAMLKASQQRIDENQVRQASATKTPIESLPDLEQQPVSPVVQAKLSATLAQIRGEKAAIIASGDADAGRKLSDLDDQELSAMEQTQGQGVMGEQLTPEADRVPVVGTTHFEKPGYRIIKVDDDPENVKNGFTPGDLVSYSTKFENAPTVEGDKTTFDVPVRYHTKGVKDNQVLADVASLVEQKPNIGEAPLTAKGEQSTSPLALPTQEESPFSLPSENGLAKQREFAADLTDVKSRLDAVQPGDTEGLRQAIQAYNGVRVKHGYEPLNDAQVAQYQARVNAKTTLDAVKGQVSTAQLRAAQKEQLLKSQNDELAKWVKDPVHGPEIVSMFNATEAGRAGSFVKALRRWVTDGQPGGIEGLRTRAIKAKEKGGDGAPKVTKASSFVEKTEGAAKQDDPATDHVRDVRQDVAESVTQDEGDDIDADQWRRAFTDGSLTSDPKLRGFANEDHVKGWTDAANAELARLGVHERMDLVPAPKDETYIGKDGVERFEGVKHPAVKAKDGKVFVGGIHAIAQDNAVASGYKPEDLTPGWVMKSDSFLTNEQVKKKYGTSESDTLVDPDITLPVNEQKPYAIHSVPTRIPAGGGFIHDFVPYDEATNKLGKHTLPKTGVLAVSQFKNMGKEQGSLPDVAIALGKELVPEAFTLEGGTEKVNVPVLMKGLREKGERVEMGVHKTAIKPNRIDDYGSTDPDKTTVEGSPVFRNADGTPKSSISGRIYPLDKVAAKQDAQGGLTLTDPSRAPGDVPTQRWNKPTPFVPQTPEEQSRLAQLAPDSGGVGLVKELQHSVDPATKSLADTIVKNFPESLQRVFVNILQMSQEGYAQATGNREATVNLSHGTLMSNDSVRREQVMMHELMHGLTLAELDNPTNKALLDELDAQRQRLIERLPDKLKSKLNDLINRNWMSDYSQGKASMSDLSSSPEWQNVMYGLMNNKELVTQGFTDPSMQKFMNALQGPGKRGFGVFLDWVKRLLRIPTVPDSEFSHFMDTTSQILKQGDYVSDVSNFFDRQFAQKGYAPGLVREQSRKALEVVQSMAVQPSKELLLHTLSQRDPITKEYRDAETAMQEMFAEKGDAADSANAVLGEMGAPKETLAELLTEHLSGNVSDMRDAMDMLPVEVTRYLFERARDMQDVLGAVDAAASAKNDGLVNLADPKSVRGVTEDTLRSINNFLKIEKSHEQDRTRLARMQTVAPDAYFDSVLSEPSRVPESRDKGLLEKVGDVIGASGGRSLEHFLQPMAQLARSNPLFGEWYSKALLLQSHISNSITDSTKIYGRSLSPDGVVAEQPVQAELDKVYKGMSSPRTQETLNKLIWLKQQRGKEVGKVGPIDYKDPEVVKLLSGLNEKEREAVISIDNKNRLVKAAQDQKTLGAMQGVFTSLMGQSVMRDMGMKMEPAVDAANKVFDALKQAKTNPQVRDALLAAVQPKMTTEAFVNLLNLGQNMVEYHDRYSQYLVDNSDWVSAQRGGKFIFETWKGGKPVKLSAENEAHAKELVEKVGGKGITNWKPNDYDSNDAVAGGITPQAMDRFRELEQNRLEMLSKVLSPEQLDAEKRSSIVSQVERENAAWQAGSLAQVPGGRTLGKGAEFLPWFENHIDWVGKNAAFWERRLLRTQGETMLQEPGTAGTATADLIRQHMQELFQKDPEVGRKIQALAFTWSLGFNPATIMSYAPQTYLRSVSELIRMGHGPVAALREITKSWGDWFGGKLSDKPRLTPEEEKFIQGAKRDGQLDASMVDDEAAANEATSTNLKRVINKERPMTVGQHVSSAAGAYSTAGSWMFRQMHQANTQVTLLAAFRALKKLNPEMLPDDMRKQAYLVNAASNDVGGRANRPLGLFSGKGDFARTVAMTANSLRSYSLGTMFQLIRNLKAGLFRPEELTPAEVYSARKAAIYQLGAQFVAAGTLGMPFVAGSLALLNQAFPELEVNKKLRETMSSLLGGDTNNGHILSDMAMSGIPSMFGWDFSSRLAAGNVLPGVSEYNGFQPENLLGVPASLVTNWVNGAKKLAGGDGQGGYAFVPPAIRGIVKLAMGDANKDYRGRPILQPTPGENLGLALGFQPKRLSDLNVADRMASQSQQLDTRRQGQENQNLAEEAMKGNFGTVRAALQQSIAADKNYNPVDAVKAIARSAEEMTFPKDLRREGNVQDMDSRKQLLSSFSIDPSSPSEVQRLVFRQGIEQKLGLTQRDPQEQILAQTMDAMRQQQPDATRVALRLAAEQTLRRTAPSRQALQSNLTGAAF